jgi:hypothetical protein
MFVVERHFRFKQMMKYLLCLVPAVLILILFVIPSVYTNEAVNVWCCPMSHNESAYCREYNSREDAISAGCAVEPVNKPCDNTQCSYLGCCPSSCSWGYRRSCHPSSSFQDFTRCSTISECKQTCCVISDGTQYTHLEGFGSDWAQMCTFLEGDYFPNPCTEVEGFVGSYGSLYGYVYDSANSEPLQGVVVEAGPYKQVTDSDGYYYFDTLPVTSQDGFSMKAYFASYTQTSQEIVAVVSSNTQRQAPDIYMAYDVNSLVTIKGRVVDVNGNGISSAIVSIVGTGFSSTTDPHGFYTIRRQLSTGSYTLRASKTSFSHSELTVSVVPGLIFEGNDFILSSSTIAYPCGDGIIHPGQDCDTFNDAACPGKCLPDCKCPQTCTDLGYFCADLSYQCTGLNGQIMTNYNPDCLTSANAGISGGICCNINPLPLPECVYGEARGFPKVKETNVQGSGGTYCKCGDQIWDINGNDRYCCLVDGVRRLQTTVCAVPGSIQGLVRDSTSSLSGVQIQLSAVYQTTSNTSSTSPNYRFDSIAPGTYTITASKPGYNNFVSTITISPEQNLNYDIQLVSRTVTSPFTLRLSHIKGFQYIKLEVIVSELDPDLAFYSIKRDGIEIKRVPVSELSTIFSYIDDQTEWAKTYVYNVTAYLNFPGSSSGLAVWQSDQKAITTGDEACQGKLDNKEFCGSQVCFSTKSLAVCHENDEPPFKYRLRCNDNNLIAYAGGSPSNSVCPTGDYCVEVNDGVTVCGGSSSCETLGLPNIFPYSSSLGNVFGLFYDKSYASETCTRTANQGYKFCYYDYFYSNVLNRYVGSYTQSDQCLSCDPRGSCYDYQSENACIIDNCGFGASYNSECKWYDTYPELGRGICYSEDIVTTKYCDVCNVFNPVFYNSRCTQEVCSLLGNCISNAQETRCNSCTITSTCDLFDGDEQACIGSSPGYSFTGYPQRYDLSMVCNSSTSIVYSKDACNIGFCRYTPEGRCIKDSNADWIYDCANLAGDVGCDQDRFIPKTRMVSQNYITTLIQSLSFSTDGRETYYCISDIGEYCCPDKLMNGGSVIIPNQYYPYSNIEDEKIIWFYSKSQYDNPNEIQNRTIIIDTKPPELTVTVSEPTESILDYRLSDIEITISSHELALNCYDSLTGMVSRSQLNDATISSPTKVTFTGLPDGTYIYHVRCQDIYGNLNNSVYIDIHIDSYTLIENPRPNLITLSSSIVNLSLETKDNQYPCYYKMTSPRVETHDRFPTNSVSYINGRYYYYLYDLNLLNSDTYHFTYTCYTDETLREVVDSTNVMFTIDKLVPTTNAFVQQGPVFLPIQEGRFYSNPIIKLNCSDPKQGPPLEFGCSQIKYCFGLSTCVPVTDNAISGSTHQFQPSVSESGQYYLCMQSVDRGGNTEQPHCKTIQIDLEPPFLSITSPSNNNVIGSSNFRFTGTWNDQIKPQMMLAKIVNNQYGYQMDITNILVSGETLTGTFIGTSFLSELYAGHNTLTVTAIDSSGNYGMASVNFYYDIFAPDFIKAELYGEDITAASMQFIYTGGAQANSDLVLEFKLLTENAISHKNHEFSNRLKAVLTANDYRFMDMNNIFGTDVIANATITSLADNTITYTKELLYNNASKKYEAIFNELLDLGNYSIRYDFRDAWGNSNYYVQYFYVDDTTPPWFEVKILDSAGNNITNVQYGSYVVEITPSEPISKLYFLNYTVSNKRKSVQLTKTDGTELRGILNIPIDDLDLVNLRNARATFSIYGEDLHGLVGTIITSIKEFFITTTGPLQPIILTPDLNQGNVFYSSSINYTIEGLVFKDTNIGLADGPVHLRRNIISTSLADNNWVDSGSTRTTSNDYYEIWRHSTYGDKITFRSDDTINLNLNGYEEVFIPGRYIEFETYRTQNRKLYKIISVTYTSGVGTPIVLYDVKLEPKLIGFEGFTPNVEFQDNIRIYDKSTPDGWFDINVSLNQGSNHFYAFAYDGPNRGTNSQVFTIIYDDVPPNLINTSPSDRSITGNLNVPIYAYVEPTGSNIRSHTLIINGNQVSSVLSYDEMGFAKINYPYTAQLQEGTYSVNLIVTDMAGNTLNHQWTFEIDANAPYEPVISPAGLINIVTPLVAIDFSQNVIIDEAILRSQRTDFMLNLTSLLLYTNGKYIYQLTSQNTLIEDDYKISVKARKIVGEDYGSQGIFHQDFTVDITPPIIIQTNSPINKPTVPLYIYVKTDELAICRYGPHDVAYDSLPNTPRVQLYDTEQLLPIYDLNSLSATIYVKCMDRAGNKMVNPAVIQVNVNSLLYPPPAIYIPEHTTEITHSSLYKLIGSTFDDPNPFMWVPDVNLIIGKSSYFYSNEVEFERKLYTKSLSDTTVYAVNPGSGFIHDVSGNSIIIDDVQRVFAPGLYVEFSNNRNIDYTLYRIKSVVPRVDPTATNSIIIYFDELLPDSLDNKQMLYVYNQEAPPGWFSYIVDLNEGNNFFYAAARNSFGEGQRTNIYNIVKDTTNPVLYNEFPRNGEVIGEEQIDISIIGDGTYSQIKSADFKIGIMPVNPQIQYLKDFESKIKYSTSQPNGLHTINVKAYDESGLSAEKSWSFTIDARVPKRPSIVPNTYINNTKPTINIQFLDEVILQSAKLIGVSTSYTKDFNNFVDNNADRIYTYLSQDTLVEGEYKIEVRATKMNVTNPGVGFWYERFYVDLTPPTIISIPSEITTSKIPIQFLLITDEDAHCKFSETDKSYYQMEHDLSDKFQKNHYVSAYVSSSRTNMYIRCRDIAGNVMPSSRVVSINQGTQPPDICGDGMITGTEECDGNNWGSITGCSSYNSNFVRGTLSCNPLTCRFDVSNCISQSFCVVDSDCPSGKVCVDGTCMDVPIICNNDNDCPSGKVCFNGICIPVPNVCTSDSDCSAGEVCVDGVCLPTPAVCGNNIVEPGETCDGTDWGRVTGCSDIPGFIGGELSCNQQICHFDTSKCIVQPAVCGDGIVGPGEQCDGNLAGKSCNSFGFSGGELKCTNCLYDTSGCTGSTGMCGDGLINIGEQCDGANIPMTSCSDMNSVFSSGQVNCNNCILSTDNCVKTSVCGDGIVDLGYECDSGIKTATCRLFDRFGGGILTCNDNCFFNTWRCIASDSKCGNGFLDAGEQCDPLMQITVSCSMFGNYQYGEVRCDSQCRYDLSGCSRTPIYIPRCGNGQIDTSLGHQCDGNIVPKSCLELGFSKEVYPLCYPQGHTNECHYDVTPCGVSTICSGSETKACNEISSSYVDGIAVCKDGYFDMSACWSRSQPEVILPYINQVSSNIVNITGTVSGAKRLELYVEGLLIDSYTYNIPDKTNFTFNNVYLPKSTLTSDGKNEIILIAYGAFEDIKTTFSRIILVDNVGPEITIVEPSTLRTSVNNPTIIINTTKESLCHVTYNSFSYSYTDYFNSDNGKIHSVTLLQPLLDNQQNSLRIECYDNLNNIALLNTQIYVDKAIPKILDVILLTPNQTVSVTKDSYKLITLYEKLDSKIKAKADSEVRCKYGIETTNYNLMSDYNTNIISYLTEWESFNSLTSTQNSLSIYTICENMAGLKSEAYELEIIVDPEAELIITNLNPHYINLEQPTIKIETNRPATCTLKYGTNTKPMSRTTSETGYEHFINIVEFNNLKLQHDNLYDFTVKCDSSSVASAERLISIRADLVAPLIHVISPENNEVFFLTEQIALQLSTEPISNVEIYLNDMKKHSINTQNGVVNSTLFLSPNRNIITIVVTDKAGNQNSTSLDVYFVGEPILPYIDSIFPEDNELVNSVNKLTAKIWTVFGVELDLTKSYIELKNKDGLKISGQKEFLSGTPENPIGALTYTLSNSLPDGEYSWVIYIEDEFGNKGEVSYFNFKVERAIPIIYLTSPITADSNSMNGNLLYHTSDQIFKLIGRVESLSEITEAYYQINKGAGFGPREPLYISNGFFDRTITLDNLAQGSTKSYIIQITVKNSAGYVKEFLFDVLHDLKPPIILGVNIS